VKSLIIFNLNFGVLSYCQSQRFHIDYSEDLAGNVWTVVIPLILVNNSNPELLMESSHTKKKFSMSMILKILSYSVQAQSIVKLLLLTAMRPTEFACLYQ